MLRGVSLEVGRLKTVAVVGRSGTGKSVLLKHVAGLLRPDEGSIVVDGVDLVRAGRDGLCRIHRQMGYVFQEGGLLNSLSVFDNIALPLRESGRFSEQEIRTRVEERLARVGVSDAATQFPSQLSGGMRKRAGMARAMIEEHSFFFLDEPTLALDPVTAAAIRNLIREVQTEWRSTSLIVTHDLRLAQEVAQEIAFLHEGRVREVGPYAEVAHSEDPVVRGFFEAGADA